MRFFPLIALVIIGYTYRITIKPGELNGTWIPVKQEMGGKPIPSDAFQSQKLIINDTLYSFTAESEDKGVVRYNDGKMDIYGKDGVNAGKHFTAIYKHENNELAICYNLLGDSYPESFDTKSSPLLFLCIFQKANAK